MDQQVTRCWGDFLQLAAIKPADAGDDQMRDLAAAQPREIDAGLRKGPLVAAFRSRRRRSGS
eukprot:4577797-Alexandrium_andersonii.AAC.1